VHPEAPERIAAQDPVTRVVTYADRRTSVRLEQPFWDALERMAARQGVRVGTLIGRIDREFRGKNLTAHLRTVCLLDCERQIAQTRLAADTAQTTRLLRWSPAPGLVLGPDARILEQNEACDTWLAETHLVGQRFADAFRIRTRQAFRDLWQRMQSTGRPITGVGLIRIAAGRVHAAEATVVPTPTEGAGETGPAFVWIAVRQTRRHGPSAPAPDPNAARET
jgi:predicted DNA-binding ribbon-helix-helix protein